MVCCMLFFGPLLTPWCIFFSSYHMNLFVTNTLRYDAASNHYLIVWYTLILYRYRCCEITSWSWSLKIDDQTARARVRDTAAIIVIVKYQVVRIHTPIRNYTLLLYHRANPPPPNNNNNYVLWYKNCTILRCSYRQKTHQHIHASLHKILLNV